ncbi:hypothetical protein EON65_37245 [archaeon]|nr:MAG: hypothetical protein EON65_37245 [archaeon]
MLHTPRRRYYAEARCEREDGRPRQVHGDLADLSVEEGSSPDPNTKKNSDGVRGDVSRTRILSGMRIDRHHLHTTARHGLGVRVVDDYDDIYLVVSKEASN